MSKIKPKIMSSRNTQIIIENVEDNIYLGHIVKLGKVKQTAEIARRIGLSWAALSIFKNLGIPMCLKEEKTILYL